MKPTKNNTISDPNQGNQPTHMNDTEIVPEASAHEASTPAPEMTEKKPAAKSKAHTAMNDQPNANETASEMQTQHTDECTALAQPAQAAPPPSGGGFPPLKVPLTLAPLPIQKLPNLPKDLFYCRANRLYYLKMPSGNWIELNMGRIFDHLKESYGLSPKAEDGEMSEVEQVIYRIEQFRTVDCAIQLAGYPEGFLEQGDVRILVTSSPKFILPKPGDWSMLKGIFNNLLGDEQLTYFYGWLKVSLQMFSDSTWMCGQVLALCGPRQAGKNLLASLVQKLFGGRSPGKPYDFMTQKTTFNADLIGAELLTIEDEVSHTDIKTRRVFASRIKDIAANNDRRLHKKYADGLTVLPLQRLIISLNDEPERVMILPPMDDDVADKMMIFKVQRHAMPMPTNTPQARKAFSDALAAQLPAFVHFLNEWEIPDELKADRFGVAHYHHPDILLMLNAQAPETKLLSLIDEVLFPAIDGAKPWRGKAIELERKLLGVADENIQREARKLLSSTNCCGRYLGRLADKQDGRVVKHPGHAGIHNWTIHPPVVSAESAGVSAPLNEGASGVYKSLARIKASLAEKEAGLEQTQGGDLDMAA